MATQEEIELVDQATLHKLAFVQALLKRKEFAFSGTREIVRARCLTHLDNGELNADELKSLLESLDLWGNQRIRLLHVPDGALQMFQDTASVELAIQQAGFTGIYQQEIPLIVEAQVSPISIRYSEVEGVRTLTLIAGKIQEEWVPVETLPELTYESVAALLQQADIPDNNVVFRPFKLQRRKIVSFAEIDLDSGHGLLSVKSTQTAGSYKSKFEEFCWAFDPLLCVSNVDTVYLTKAISRVDDPGLQDHLDLPRQYLRDEQGARMRMEASSGQGDVRQHPKLRQARACFTGDDSGDYCVCYWNPDGLLTEKVHTCIYGSHGEVAFRGQAGEESIRYVLQRIRQLNN